MISTSRSMKAATPGARAIEHNTKSMAKHRCNAPTGCRNLAVRSHVISSRLSMVCSMRCLGTRGLHDAWSPRSFEYALLRRALSMSMGFAAPQAPVGRALIDDASDPPVAVRQFQPARPKSSSCDLVLSLPLSLLRLPGDILDLNDFPDHFLPPWPFQHFKLLITPTPPRKRLSEESRRSGSVMAGARSTLATGRPDRISARATSCKDSENAENVWPPIYATENRLQMRYACVQGLAFMISCASITCVE